jgi:hypothetical protein
VLYTSESLDRKGLENPTIIRSRIGPPVETPLLGPTLTVPTTGNWNLTSLNLFAIPLAFLGIFSEALWGSFLDVDNPKWQIHSKGARFVLCSLRFTIGRPAILSRSGRIMASERGQ